MIGNPTSSQARDAISVAARIEIRPGTRLDNAIAHTADVSGNATIIADCIRAQDRFCIGSAGKRMTALDQ